MPAKYTPEQRLLRFWTQVDPCRTDGCALWLGAVSQKGYGRFAFGGCTRNAHQFLVGRPPKGLEWDHVKARGCTHKNCVWPEHLELVTHAENLRRGSAWHHLADLNRIRVWPPSVKGTPEAKAKHAANERARRARLRASA